MKGREVESWKEKRCGAFLHRRVQTGGKGGTEAAKGCSKWISLFVMRLLFLPLPKHVVFSGGRMERRMESSSDADEDKW